MTAAEQDHRFLQHPAVAKAIAKGQAVRAGQVQITLDAVVIELAKLGFSNALDYIWIGSDGDPIVDLSRLSGSNWFLPLSPRLL